MNLRKEARICLTQPLYSIGPGPGLAEARASRELENDRRVEAIYQAHPRLREIDRQLRATAAQIMAATFRRGGDPSAAIAEIRAQNLALQQEREWILESEGIDEARSPAEPVCTVCGGSGYVGARMCECLKELCRQEQKKELSSLLGGRESFDAFRLDYYPADFDPKLGASPREQMQYTLLKCRRYARDFSADSPSLLFPAGRAWEKPFSPPPLPEPWQTAAFPWSTRLPAKSSQILRRKNSGTAYI